MTISGSPPPLQPGFIEEVTEETEAIESEESKRSRKSTDVSCDNESDSCSSDDEADHEVKKTAKIRAKQLDPSGKAKPTDSSKKSIKTSTKSEWFPALQKFVQDNKSKCPKGFPKVHCRIKHDGQRYLSDTYLTKAGKTKIRFEVTWEIDMGNNIIYSTNPPLTKEKPGTTIRSFGKEFGNNFNNHYVYSNIEYPPTNNAHDVLSAERFALLATVLYTDTIKFAVNDLDGSDAAAKKARNEIIKYLSRNNFIRSVLKDAQNNSIPIFNYQGDKYNSDGSKPFKRFSQISNMTILINDKEYALPESRKSALKKISKVAHAKISLQYSEGSAYSNLNDDQKKLYNYRQYDLMLEKVEFSEEFSHAIVTNSETLRVLSAAKEELEAFGKSPNSKVEEFPSLEKWSTDANALLDHDANNLKDAKHLIEESIRTTQNNKARIEADFRQRYRNKLDSATTAPGGVGEAFASQDTEQVIGYAFHVQQELADLESRHAYLRAGITGDSHPSHMAGKFNRTLDKDDVQRIVPEKKWYNKILTAIDKGILEQQSIYVPYAKPIPFLPFKPVKNLVKYTIGMVVPNSVKRFIEERRTPDLRTLQLTTDLDAPGTDLTAAELNNDESSTRKNMLLNFYDALLEMEKLEYEMERLKTINSALYEYRVMNNGVDPLSGNANPISKEFWKKVNAGLILNSPSDWDQSQRSMARFNMFTHMAVSKIERKEKITFKEQKAEEIKSLKTKPQFTYAENLQPNEPPKPPKAKSAKKSQTPKGKSSLTSDPSTTIPVK